MPEYRHDLRDVLETIKTLQAQMRAFEVELLFDRQRPLTPVSAATFRGLLGWMLAEAAPDMVNSFFKPGAGDTTAAAFAITQLDRATRQTGAAAFRIVTFTDPDNAPPRIAQAITKFAPGRSFGDQDTKVLKAETTRSLAVAIPFPPENIGLSSADIVFRSPICLKRHGRLVGPRQMSLAFLVSGIIERLNQLAMTYAGTPALQTAPAVAIAALTFEERKNLRWERWARLSHAQQGTKIDMNGCTGSMLYSKLLPELQPILSWAALANVGRHASAGSGAIQVTFPPAAAPQRPPAK